MVKLSLILLFVILLLIGIADEFSRESYPSTPDIKSSKIDAKSTFDAAATSVNLSVSLTILSDFAVLTINSPVNKTYEDNRSIILDVDVVNGSYDVDAFYYNIDNGTNITLTLNDGGNITTFDTSFGSHYFYVFANDTWGYTNFSMVAFDVNDSIRYSVLFTKFNASTTNFTLLNNSQLQNITNMTLEISSRGKIEFTEAINLTDDNLTDSKIDLDSYVNITSFIYINDTSFPNLMNKTATLYFYNITYTVPRLLRNGVVCTSDICTVNWTVGQTYIVNITGFVAGGNTFTVEEGAGVAAAVEEEEEEEAAARRKLFRGNVRPEEEVKVPKDKEAEWLGPRGPLIELPFKGKRLIEVTPKLVLNRYVTFVISALVLLVLLLEYVKYLLKGKK